MDSKNLKILTLLHVVLCVVVFLACLGVSTSASRINREMIDSLSREVKNVRHTIDSMNYVKSRSDTIIFDVKVKPQVIKIYNKCTN